MPDLKIVIKEHFGDIYKIISQEKEINSRTKAEYNLKKDCLEIKVEAKDYTALRANVNSLLQKLALIDNLYSKKR
jgi:tRNA threonylcarbamoyladenosine modification (KEOPS) complex  Pcc1 subunit